MHMLHQRVCHLVIAIYKEQNHETSSFSSEEENIWNLNLQKRRKQTEDAGIFMKVHNPFT